MVTGTILSINMAYPSLQVEVAFSDDLSRLPDPTHLVYNIPVEQTEELTQDAINARIQSDATNFDSLLTAIDSLQPSVDATVTNTGMVTMSQGLQTKEVAL